MFVGCYTRPMGHIKGILHTSKAHTRNLNGSRIVLRCLISLCIAGDRLGEGVYTFLLRDDGSLTELGVVRADNPSFVCSSHDITHGHVVYCVHEVRMQMDQSDSLS